MPRGKPPRKLAISVDADVAERVGAAAAEDGISVSAGMTDAARRTLLIRDGLAAVAEWEAENRPFAAEEISAARRRIATDGGEVGAPA